MEETKTIEIIMITRMIPIMKNVIITRMMNTHLAETTMTMKMTTPAAVITNVEEIATTTIMITTNKGEDPMKRMMMIKTQWRKSEGQTQTIILKMTKLEPMRTPMTTMRTMITMIERLIATPVSVTTHILFGSTTTTIEIRIKMIMMMRNQLRE